MSSKHSQGHGYSRERDTERRVDYGRDSRDREPRREDRHHRRSHREDDGDRVKDYDRSLRHQTHTHSRSRGPHESRSPQRDRGGGSHTGTTPSKGGTPGPKGNSVLAELLRQAKARQQQESGAGAGGSGSGSDGEAPEAGEILPQGAAAAGGGGGGGGLAGSKRRYHSPIVWNLDGPSDAGRAGSTAPPRPPPAKRPASASASAVERAAEELAAFRRQQTEEAGLGYDPDGPPAVKSSPSVSGSEEDDQFRGRDGGRERSAGPRSDSGAEGREQESGGAAGGGRWRLDDDEEEEDAGDAARGGRAAAASRWVDSDGEAGPRGGGEAAGRGRGADAGAGGAEDGERRQDDGERASGSPRRAVSGGDALSGREGAGRPAGRGSSASRSPGAGPGGEGGGSGAGEDGAEADQSLISAQIASLAECRSVDEYERLNRVSEGTYGVVFRARCKRTGRICALKKIKMEKERDGFPVTSIREINILLNLHHPNIVNVSEVVMGSRLDQIFMVMEFMDHDLKSLMHSGQMVRSFSVAEVKCLMTQLISGIDYLHQNWVIHRDLKTSNILYNNAGELKTCDFGLARQFGSPLRPYTQPVVTLWYRPPELLLGETLYSTAVDMWSIGCIMAELLTGKPLFDGQGEIEQLDKICGVLGTPNEDVWPGLKKLPNWGKIVLRPQPSQLRQRFSSAFGSGATLTEAGFDLLSRLLAYDPAQRITAGEALEHRWFSESPFPQRRELMPTFRSNKDGSGAVRQAAAAAPGSPPLPIMSAALKAR